MALLQGAAPGTDIVLTEERMESSRAFANKIWNAARFLNVGEPAANVGQASGLASSDSALGLEDRWIFSRLNAVAAEANRAIDQYRYHEYAQLIWHFFWHEFCDWYIELKKAPGTNTHHATRAFEIALRLLHPAMPFLTEELWQRLGQSSPKSIALAAYPQFDPKLSDAEAEKEVAIVQDVVTLARTLRTENKLDPKQTFAGTLFGHTDSLAIAQRHGAAIQKIARVNLAFQSGAAPKTGAVRSTPEFDLVLDIPKAADDPARRQKELEQLAKNIANHERQLQDETFLGKAPAKVIDGMRAKLAEYKTQLSKLEGL
jgi:valyl-tRNA synthetase